MPNQPGGVDGQGNYLSPMTRTDTYYSVMGRTDFNIDDRNRLMFKWFGNDRVERKGNLFNNIGTGAILPRLNSGAMVDYVRTFSSTTMVNSRFGWTRFADHETRESTGFDIASIGFPASLAAASLNPGPAADHVRRHDHVARSDGRQRRRRRVLDRVRLVPVVHVDDRVEGDHTLKFGADLRLLREESINYENSAGTYTFGTQWTRGPMDNSAAAPHGQALASLLLGLPTGGQFDVNTSRQQPGVLRGAVLPE